MTGNPLLQQKVLVIRRGSEWYEVKLREQSDSKFQTTKIPVKPACQRPAWCKWCAGMEIMGQLIEFPLDEKVYPDKVIRHKITPPLASHLVAFEWGQQHPNVPFSVMWLLTDDEIAAGKKGFTLPQGL